MTNSPPAPPTPTHSPLHLVLAPPSRPPPGQRGCGCGWIARGIEWDGGSSWSWKLAASSCWCMVVYALQKVSSAAKLHQRGLKRSSLYRIPRALRVLPYALILTNRTHIGRYTLCCPLPLSTALWHTSANRRQARERTRQP